MIYSYILGWYLGVSSPFPLSCAIFHIVVYQNNLLYDKFDTYEGAIHFSYLLWPAKSTCRFYSGITLVRYRNITYSCDVMTSPVPLNAGVSFHILKFTLEFCNLLGFLIWSVFGVLYRPMSQRFDRWKKYCCN